MTFFFREYVSYDLEFVHRVAVSNWHVKTFAIVAHLGASPHSTIMTLESVVANISAKTLEISNSTIGSRG